MKIAGFKNIVFTIWFDNVFGCVNKCKFCNLSKSMIERIDYNNIQLFDFLSKHSSEIRLLKLMGQEPYRENDMVEVVEKLLQSGFQRSIINLTTIGSSLYPKLLEVVGYLTLSFSGYNPEYYGFKSSTHPYKKNIIHIINAYNDKIDKLNWIIGKFNLNNIDKDLSEFFESINGKKVKITFLLQKGILYSKNDVVLFLHKMKQIEEVFIKYHFYTFEKDYHFYDSSYNVSNNDLENTELTYAYNRELDRKWYRCSWELTGGNELISPEEYIQGTYANNCTKVCAGNLFKKHPDYLELFYYKLMLKKLGDFETLLYKI